MTPDILNRLLASSAALDRIQTLLIADETGRSPGQGSIYPSLLLARILLDLDHVAARVAQHADALDKARRRGPTP